MYPMFSSLSFGNCLKNSTTALAVINCFGCIEYPTPWLWNELAQVKNNPKNRARVIYLSVLGRDPAPDEFRLAMSLFKQEKQVIAGDRSLVWILLNTPEFMFIQ